MILGQTLQRIGTQGEELGDPLEASRPALPQKADVRGDTKLRTRGRFAGEIDLAVGPNPVTLVAKNPHGETRGPAFILERDDDPLHQPHVRELSQATVETRCALAVDENDGVFLGCRDRLGFVEPHFYYGTAGFLGPLERVPDLGANPEGLELLHAGVGGPILIASQQVGGTDSLVAYRAATTGWSAFPLPYTYDPQCACTLTGALDDDGRPVVVFDDWEVTAGPRFVLSRRWDGAAWQAVTLPAAAAAIADARFLVAHVQGVGVLLALSSSDGVRLFRLDADRWLDLGAPIGGPARPLVAEALFAGADGRPWLVTAAEGEAHALCFWDGIAWIEDGTQIPGAGPVFGAATLGGESFVGVQSETGMAIHRREAASQAWTALASPSSTATCPVPADAARMVTGGREPSLFVGWPCGDDFFVVRLRDGAFEDFVTTAGLEEATPISFSHPPELEIVDGGRMYLLFSQGERLFLDEWDGTRWLAHAPSLPELPGRNPERPRSVLDDDGTLYVAAVGSGGEAVFRWSGSDWEQLATLDNGERILDVFVAATNIHVASLTPFPEPVALTVRAFVGGAWQQLGGALNEAPDTQVDFARLTMDPTGRIVLVSVENGTRLVYVHRFDAAAWQALGGSLSTTRVGEPFVRPLANGDLYLLEQEDFSFLFDPTMMKWTDADGTWTVVGADPLNVGQVDFPFSHGAASAVFTDTWMAVALRETVAPATAPQVSFYVSFYTDAWVRHAPPIAAATQEKLYVVDDELVWLSSSPFGGHQLTTVTRPW